MTGICGDTIDLVTDIQLVVLVLLGLAGQISNGIFLHGPDVNGSEGVGGFMHGMMGGWGFMGLGFLWMILGVVLAVVLVVVIVRALIYPPREREYELREEIRRLREEVERLRRERGTS